MNPWGDAWDDAWGDSDTDNEDETTHVDTVRVVAPARDESFSHFHAALARVYRCSLYCMSSATVTCHSF